MNKTYIDPWNVDADGFPPLLRQLSHRPARVYCVAFYKLVINEKEADQRLEQIAPAALCISEAAVRCLSHIHYSMYGGGGNAIEAIPEVQFAFPRRKLFERYVLSAVFVDTKLCCDNLLYL